MSTMIDPVLVQVLESVEQDYPAIFAGLAAEFLWFAAQPAGFGKDTSEIAAAKLICIYASERLGPVPLDHDRVM